MAIRPSQNDPVLTRLFRGDAEARNTAVEEILDRHARPHLDEILARQVSRGVLAESDLVDMTHEASLRLLRKLRRLASGSDSEPIPRFASYVSAAARSVVEDHVRRQDPFRSQLVNRIRYVLNHTPNLAVWGRSPVLCGFEAWIDEVEPAPVVPPGPLPASAAEDGRELRRIVSDMLQAAGGPVELLVLVDAVAEACGLAKQPFVAADALVDRSVASDPIQRLLGREYLQRLWGEISSLPPRQRCALLLQLRLDEGESVIRVLAALGIATFEALAGALSMSPAELYGIWHRLPLPDDVIAQMLSASRQQVINLRKSARERLARRLGRTR